MPAIIDEWSTCQDLAVAFPHQVVRDSFVQDMIAIKLAEEHVVHILHVQMGSLIHLLRDAVFKGTPRAPNT